MPRKLDLTGQRFGKLTVLRPAENIAGRTAWTCLCDCGRETVVRTSHLRSGITKTCGCQHSTGDPLALTYMGVTCEEKRTLRKRLDLSGQRFSMLTVLRPAENVGGQTAWVCRCDCGQETVVRTAHLRSGHTKTCGHRTDDYLKTLRSETEQERYTSGVRGVYWIPRERRWKATICFQRKRYYLGVYLNVEDAVRARKKAEEELHGNFLREFIGAETHDVNSSL